MAAPLPGICSAWATSADIPDGLGVDPEQVAARLAAASDLLFRMTGHQWPGECTTTIRPRGRYPDCQGGGCCTCATGRLVLLPAPVISVDSVVIDGTVLDPAAYRVDDWRLLVRVDGDPWPRCQPLDLPDGEPGTWSVTVTYGAAPPPSGVAAAVALAAALAKAACGDSACGLPDRAVRVARAGVEYELEPADLLDHGRTGIFEVDLFLRSVNPQGLARPARVRTPDLPRHRVAGT